MPKKSLALVKWVSGEDRGTFTPGIPIDWIRDFDEQEFLSGKVEDDVSFLVEWRDKKKEPAGGWTVFDAQVIDVSDSMEKLNKRMRMLSLPVSPKQRVDASLPQGVPSGIRKSPRKSSKVNLFSASSKVPSQEKASDSAGVRRKKETIPLLSPRKKLKTAGPGNQSGNEKRAISFEDSLGSRQISGVLPIVPSDVETHHELLTSLGGSIKKLQGTTDALQGVSVKLGKLAEKFEHKFEELMDRAITETAARDSRENVTVVAHEECPSLSLMKAKGFVISTRGDMVSIKKDGNEVKLNSNCWKSACKSGSGSAMTGNLIVGAFPLQTLLSSSYKGGKTKVGDNKGRQQNSLGSKTIGYIKDIVQARWPSFLDVHFGVAVNGKLNSLKAKHKKKQVEEESKAAGNAQTDKDGDESGDESGGGEEEIGDEKHDDGKNEGESGGENETDDYAAANDFGDNFGKRPKQSKRLDSFSSSD